MKIQTAAAILLTLVIMLGCSVDPKAVNEKNFIRAIDAYHEQTPCIVSSGLFWFPKQIDTKSYTFESNRNFLDTFVEAGLLTRAENLNSAGKGSITYDLTESGKQYFRKDTAKGSLGKQNGFYYGQRKISKLEKFSEPIMAMGHKICEVQYTYTVSDMQQWATKIDTEGLGWRIRTDVKAIQNPQPEKTTLVLADSGWVHEKLFK